MGACGQVDAPVVQADRHVEQKGVHAGEIEIEEAGEGNAVKHHVVAEQVGMHRAAGQGGVGRAGRHMVLVGQFAAQQVGLGRLQEGQHHRHGVVPPGQAAQIGLAAVEVLAGQVHTCQHRAHGGAVGHLRRQLALAGEFVDHGGGFALHAVQDLAVAVGLRVGHGNAALRQVLHQVQVERQLLGGEALEQGQHIVGWLPVLVGGDEVVGVFDAAFDAAQGAQLTQAQALCECACVGFGHFRKNCHGDPCAFRISGRSTPAGPSWTRRLRVGWGVRGCLRWAGSRSRACCWPWGSP